MKLVIAFIMLSSCAGFSRQSNYVGTLENSGKKEVVTYDCQPTENGIDCLEVSKKLRITTLVGLQYIEDLVKSKNALESFKKNCKLESKLPTALVDLCKCVQNDSPDNCNAASEKSGDNICVFTTEQKRTQYKKLSESKYQNISEPQKSCGQITSTLLEVEGDAVLSSTNVIVSKDKKDGSCSTFEVGMTIVYKSHDVKTAIDQKCGKVLIK